MSSVGVADDVVVDAVVVDGAVPMDVAVGDVVAAVEDGVTLGWVGVAKASPSQLRVVTANSNDFFINNL